MNKFVSLPAVGVAALTVAACGGAATEEAADTSAAITVEEVDAARAAWGEGIVAIGAVHTEGGDVAARATEHINQFYGYEDDKTVLFKPTLTSEDQFREDFDGALSYFIGTEGTEDGGFAIKPYTDVRWENHGTVVDGDSAMAMGNYFFTDTDGNETKVEYSFGYEKNDDGELVIVLHHSSLPFTPS